MAEIEAGVVEQRAAAEAEGRIREARENEDLRRVNSFPAVLCLA
jgi:hypothetical protein